MAAGVLDAFEPLAEAYLRARGWREWQYLAGLRPGRGLVSLYADFPDVTSTDLWLDVKDAEGDEPPRARALLALLTSAYLEGRTRPYASSAAGFALKTTVEWENKEVVWREAPAHWALVPEVPRRHALAEGWRDAMRNDLKPSLERWHEALRAELGTLGNFDWLALWGELRGIDVSAHARLAQWWLETSSEVFGHAFGVYLGQLELPLDDSWQADVDWALRAPRFDAVFPERSRMPVLVRTFRDLGMEIEAQPELLLEAAAAPGVHMQAVDVPNQAHVLLRLSGGWQDYAHSLRGIGMAQHILHTDASLPAWQRWLGDATPTLGYGLLLEGLVRDKAWLGARMEYFASDDLRIIAHIAWLHRVRRRAVGVLYEQRLWQVEPGASLAADYETEWSTALRTHRFADEYLLPLVDAPWSTLRPAVELRAEVFAAQLRAYLRREFDEEWWRSNRASRFLVQELWRPGRRHTAEELLGFMGYEGFDPSVLWSEFNEVLSPL